LVSVFLILGEYLKWMGKVNRLKNPPRMALRWGLEGRGQKKSPNLKGLFGFNDEGRNGPREGERYFEPIN
jgi:hypothetical protein